MESKINHQFALKLRRLGKTYGEIRHVLRIPKSTQSSWFKNLKLSTKAKTVLVAKQRNGLRALTIFNQNRTFAIQNENEEIRKLYEGKIKTLTKYELMLIGASLYWAEGYKNFNNRRKDYPYLGFTNTDPQMIIIFLKFLNTILGIRKKTIYGSINLSTRLSPIKSLEYWQKTTSLPKKNLHVL